MIAQPLRGALIVVGEFDAIKCCGRVNVLVSSLPIDADILPTRTALCTAIDFGEQQIFASGRKIPFSVHYARAVLGLGFSEDDRSHEVPERHRSQYALDGSEIDLFVRMHDAYPRRA